MKLEEFAEKAITLEEVPFGNVSIDQVAALVVRWGFPAPGSGVVLFTNRRGDTNNGVDWAARKLREYLIELIHDVVGESIGAINDTEDLSEEDRKKAVQAIRTRFGLIVH